MDIVDDGNMEVVECPLKTYMVHAECRKKLRACLAFPRIRDGRCTDAANMFFLDAFEERGAEWGGAEENNRIADSATVSEDGRSSDLVTRSILIIG